MARATRMEPAASSLRMDAKVFSPVTRFQKATASRHRCKVEWTGPSTVEDGRFGRESLDSVRWKWYSCL